MKTLLSREDNEENLGLEHLFWISTTAQATLSSQAKPGTQKLTAILPPGKTERSQYQTLPVVRDCYPGVHGKLSFYF